jgi:hypothetical protein
MPLIYISLKLIPPVVTDLDALLQTFLSEVSKKSADKKAGDDAVECLPIEMISCVNLRLCSVPL